jgi:D-alanyl-D-alanine dipeptidase
VFFFSISVAFKVAAQSKIVNKYGLTVINNIKVLQNEIVADSSMQMINLQEYIPGIYLNLKYATTDNFMHERLYPSIRTLFCKYPLLMY